MGIRKEALRAVTERNKGETRGGSMKQGNGVCIGHNRGELGKVERQKRP